MIERNTYRGKIIKENLSNERGEQSRKHEIQLPIPYIYFKNKIYL